MSILFPSGALGCSVGPLSTLSYLLTSCGRLRAGGCTYRRHMYMKLLRRFAPVAELREMQECAECCLCPGTTVSRRREGLEAKLRGRTYR